METVVLTVVKAREGGLRKAKGSPLPGIFHVPAGANNSQEEIRRKFSYRGKGHIQKGAWASQESIKTYWLFLVGFMLNLGGFFYYGDLTRNILLIM